jgi:hypothetical protein
LTKVFGNPEGEIKYLDFIKAANPLEDNCAKEAVRTYVEKFLEFKGETELDKLLRKIKIIVKKDRIRLMEFF